MKRENQNYMFIFMGFIVLFLLFLMHYVESFADMIRNYNDLIEYVNRVYDKDLNYYKIYFFGEMYGTINFIVDLLLVSIIVVVLLMIFLKIYWSVKNGSTK